LVLKTVIYTLRSSLQKFDHTLSKFIAFKEKYCLITNKDGGAEERVESLAKVIHKIQVVVEDVTLSNTTFEVFTCPSVVYNEHS
jgi:hypothetical protein